MSKVSQVCLIAALLGLTAPSLANLTLAANAAKPAAPLGQQTVEWPKVVIKPFFDARIMQVVLTDLNNFGEFQAAADSKSQQDAQYTVVNQTIQQDDALVINFWVIDDLTKQAMNGKQTVRLKNNSQSRMAGHQMADRIYALLTNKQGDSSGLKYQPLNN